MRGRQARRARSLGAKVAIYGALRLWTFFCIFPIYWTATKSFKIAPDVMRGHLIPRLDYAPNWKGWRSLGLSPDTIIEFSNPRAQFLSRFSNSLICSVSASFTHAITLPAMVAKHTGSQVVGWWKKAALTGASILPLLLVGIFLERFVVKGMAAGAVK